MRYVILGTGPAGVFAVEAIRKADPEATVTVVSPEPPYSPCLLSRFVAGRLAREGLLFREALDGPGVEVRTGGAVALDASGRTVSLDDGTALPYDRLLVAVGARPVLPDVPGVDLDGVLCFKTLADAERLAALAPSLGHAVVVGAGLAGLEAAEALTTRGVRVTVLEALDRVLPLVLGPGAAARVERTVREAGVDVRPGSRLGSILGDGRVEAVVADGEEVPADAAVLTVGVAPRIGWLEGSGVLTRRGVAVDEGMATSVAGVYAAGDVAELPGPDGEGRVLAIWPVAARGGRVAGLNMAGVEAKLGVPEVVNVARLFGLPVVAGGEATGDDEWSSEESGVYRRLVFRSGALVGFEWVGAVEGTGVLLSLAASRAPADDALAAVSPRGPSYARVLGRRDKVA